MHINSHRLKLQKCVYSIVNVLSNFSMAIRPLCLFFHISIYLFSQVKHFQNINKAHKEICKKILNAIDDTVTHVIPKSKWSSAIVLDKSLCNMIQKGKYAQMTEVSKYALGIKYYLNMIYKLVDANWWVPVYWMTYFLYAAKLCHLYCLASKRDDYTVWYYVLPTYVAMLAYHLTFLPPSLHLKSINCQFLMHSQNFDSFYFFCSRMIYCDNLHYIKKRVPGKNALSSVLG